MSAKIDIAAAQGAAQLIKQAVQQLQDTHAQLAAKRDGLRQRIADLRNAALRLDEVKAFILADIDRQAREFPGLAGWGKIIDSVCYPAGHRPRAAVPGETAEPASWDLVTEPRRAICLQDLGRPVFGLAGLGRGNFFTGLEDNKATEGQRAAFLFGDVIKARVSEFFDRKMADAQPPTGDAALTVTERKQAIEKAQRQVGDLDAEIRAVEAQLQELQPDDAEARQRDARFHGAVLKMTADGWMPR